MFYSLADLTTHGRRSDTMIAEPKGLATTDGRLISFGCKTSFTVPIADSAQSQMFERAKSTISGVLLGPDIFSATLINKKSQKLNFQLKSCLVSPSIVSHNQMSGVEIVLLAFDLFLHPCKFEKNLL